MRRVPDGPQRRLDRYFKGAVAKILSGTLVGQGLLLAVSPLLTRIYSPEDFAALTAFTAIIVVLGGVATLSWERAIVIPHSARQATALATLTFVTTIFTTAVIAITAYILRHALDGIFGTSVFVDLWWLLPATTAAMGVNATALAWLVRRQQYGGLARRNAVQGVAQAVSSLGLGAGGFGPVGLLSGIAIGRLSAVFSLSRSTWSGLKKPSPRFILATAARFSRFPFVSTWSRLLNTLGLQLPSLLIVALYGVHEAGLYALTVRVLATPVGMLSDAVSQYFEAAFSKLMRARSGGLRNFIWTIVSRLLLIAAIPSVLLALFAPSLFGWIFGEQWADAGSFAQIAIIFYVAQLSISPISRSLPILERQGIQLAWDASRVLLTLMAIAIPSIISARPSLLFTVAWLSITQALLYAGLLFLCLQAAARKEALS